MPPPQPHDVPAGGLDVPPKVVPTAAGENPADPLEEAFPGESQLTPEERNRWLVLHFALPRTIMTCDMAAGRSTEEELNDCLASMAWGSVEQGTSEWGLESQSPTLEPPHPSLISYSEYVERTYPTDGSMEEWAREENLKMAMQKRCTFTNPGEPGAKFRPMFDQMVKNLQHASKALIKAYDVKKPMLIEDDVPEDETRPELQNIMRFGRHQILPAFWQLLTQLTRRGRRFSLVFRSFSEEQLSVLQKELFLFCQGQHPAYDGKNKTQKPPPMSGEKASRDLRLYNLSIGRLSQEAKVLTFSERPAGEAPKVARPGEVVAPPAVPAGQEADLDGTDAPEFVPTAYNFSESYHEVYAGMQNQILVGANSAAILEDKSAGGKLLLVDHAGGMAESQVQHLLFDGSLGGIGSSGEQDPALDLRDVVTGKPLAPSEATDIFTHRVDFFNAATDVDYFVQAVEACERNFSEKILASRETEQSGLEKQAAEAHESQDQEQTLPAKEYLYRNIIPALMPALEACQRDRPPDPVEFIALYMLRHSKQYSKSLRG